MSPADLLVQDGYKPVKTFSGGAEYAAQGSGGPLASDVVCGAYGTKGNSTEEVLQLTPEGAKDWKAQMGPDYADPTHTGVHEHMDGVYLTTVGPTPGTVPPGPGPQEQRALDWLNWEAGPGMAALEKMNAMLGTSPTTWTPAQTREFGQAVRTAAENPLPKSIDPAGHYVKYVRAVGQAIRDAQNQYIEGAVSMIVEAAREYKALHAELVAEQIIGPDSP